MLLDAKSAGKLQENTVKLTGANLHTCRARRSVRPTAESHDDEKERTRSTVRFNLFHLQKYDKFHRTKQTTGQQLSCVWHVDF